MKTADFEVFLKSANFRENVCGAANHVLDANYDKQNYDIGVTTIEVKKWFSIFPKT